MLARYVPGAPNPWFSKHQYHGIPVNRNLKPISECKLYHCVGPAATVQKAIAVPILTAEHLAKRQNEKYPIYWAVNRNKLRFGTPFREIRDAFEQIEHGNWAVSVEKLAQHEQVNILQTIMYDDEVLRKLLDMNQYAWATGFPTGDYAEIQLTLSAQCRTKTGFTSRFSRDKGAKLWLAAERMLFVNQAAQQFNQLLNSSERPRVEESIRAIAAGGGVV